MKEINKVLNKRKEILTIAITLDENTVPVNQKVKSKGK